MVTESSKVETVFQASYLLVTPLNHHRRPHTPLRVALSPSPLVSYVDAYESVALEGVKHRSRRRGVVRTCLQERSRRHRGEAQIRTLAPGRGAVVQDPQPEVFAVGGPGEVLRTRTRGIPGHSSMGRLRAKPREEASALR